MRVNKSQLNLIIYIIHIYSVYLLYIGGSMKKLIEFNDMDKAIQEYADLFCEGNFSMAVRQLIKKGLSDE